jgi:adenylate kinase family enzyme
LGPSNSGKSTLADAISRSAGLQSIHLDQLYHAPNTNWEPRPEAEFLQLHELAIANSRWVMDGNYSRCLTQRLARATGLILLDVSTGTSLLRYVRRAWFESDRRGSLEGGADSVKWKMIRHIAITTPNNRKGYDKLFGTVELPKIKLASGREVTRFYRSEALDR